jgi:hypothetical protein
MTGRKLPEACRVVISIKLELSASVGFIHKETCNNGCTPWTDIAESSNDKKRVACGIQMNVWDWWCMNIVYRQKQQKLSLVTIKHRQLITVWAVGMLKVWELPLPVIHKMTWTRILVRSRIKINEREHWSSRMWSQVACEQLSMP